MHGHHFTRRGFRGASEGSPAGAPRRPRELRNYELAKLAAAISGFVGYYLDADRTPTVVLSDLRLAHAFEEMVFRIQASDYDFQRLLVWRVKARAVLAHDGVVFLDVDEVANRLRIGVDGEIGQEAAAQVEATLAALGVPAEAVIVEEPDPIVPMLRIHDEHGSPVANATVTGDFSGDVSGTVGGTTGSNGTVTLESDRVRTNTLSYELCVTDVTHSSLDHEPGGNAVTCASP